MNLRVTFRQLEVFGTVARLGSITRAAESLHLTQPAVSMQVKQLEAAAGLPLVEQVGRRLYLTEAGELLREVSRDIADTLNDASQRLAALHGTDGGRIQISIASTVNYFATELLAEFCRQHPRTRIVLDITNRENLLRQLENNEPDIVLMGRPPAQLDVIAEPFMDNPLVVIAAPDHPLAARKRIALKMLHGETFIMREPGSGTRMAMARFFAEHHLNPTGTLEMTSNEAIKQSVQAGLGLAIVSAHTIELELGAGRLVQLAVTGFPIRRRWYVTHRRGKRLSPAAHAFRAFVLKGRVRPEPGHDGEPPAAGMRPPVRRPPPSTDATCP